jgi:hypothetical protein
MFVSPSPHPLSICTPSPFPERAISHRFAVRYTLLFVRLAASWTKRTSSPRVSTLKLGLFRLLVRSMERITSIGTTPTHFAYCWALGRITSSLGLLIGTSLAISSYPCTLSLIFLPTKKCSIILSPMGGCTLSHRHLTNEKRHSITTVAPKIFQINSFALPKFRCSHRTAI